MRQKLINIYKFEELSDKVQQALIDEYRCAAVEDEDWWQYIADEIEGLGGKLIEFDTHRGTIKIDIAYPIDFAEAIINHHGKDCDSYKLSKQYIDGKLTGEEYVHEISEDYISMLRREYDYITADEYIWSDINELNNEYYEDGTLA